ncbi:MAG: hypothetical protein ACR2QB_07875 [Gammaproteobacteria bacterium]
MLVTCAIILVATISTSLVPALASEGAQPGEQQTPPVKGPVPDVTAKVTEDAIERRAIQPGKELTIRQKRIFVIGLGAGERK